MNKTMQRNLYMVLVMTISIVLGYLVPLETPCSQEISEYIPGARCYHLLNYYLVIVVLLAGLVFYLILLRKKQ